MAAGATATLRTGDLSLSYAPLGSVENVERLPYSLRILLENALRFESESGVQAVAQWQPQDEPSRELGFRPSRVLLQDFTGVPAIVDVAAMRSAMADLGGDPAKINPHIPAELVIDHSVQVDAFATRMAISTNVDRDYERNGERYAFLRWGQGAFDNLKVVPPNTGIVHQVNLEYLARVIEERDGVAFPDTLVGTDSHTTMVNGLGVLGWGVGGIEAEAALLGEELSMLVPQVVGVRLDGRLREGATATDLVLTITELLRKTGVVGKFVEYFGPGLAGLALADRATIGNMSPEYGATCGFFPVDDLTLAYLRLTGRPEERVALVEAYCKENLLWHDESVEPEYSQVVELDLDSVEPSLAGPRRPQDRVPLAEAKDAFLDSLDSFGHGYGNGTIDKSVEDSFPASDPGSFQEAGPHTIEPDLAQVATATRPHLHVAKAELDGEELELQDGSVVIAAITSCTNTSNPQVMLGAALLAKKAVERGLQRKPWVKSSLAPGSRVVTDYYDKAGLTPYLEQLGFNTVGYGCTTCIGNSGPLPESISAAVEEGDLVVCSVLSGNRNFEARIHPEVKANYLASPPLVVAYALAGRMDVDLETEPLGQGSDGEDVFLRDLWPTNEEIDLAVAAAVDGGMFRKQYADVFTGDERWQALPVPEGDLYDWSDESTYIRRPPFFEGHAARARAASGRGRRALPGLARRQRHHRPHLARRLDQAGKPGRRMVDRPRRRAALLQLVWRAPRQPRDHGSRHLRQRAAEEPACSGQRGHVDGARPERRGDDDLRSGRALPRGGHAADRARRQGVRLRLVTRLGRQRARTCSACAPRSPRATSGSTARTCSCAGSCRSSSWTARASRPSA